MREKCEAWLKRRDAYPLADVEPSMNICSFLDCFTLNPAFEFTTSHRDGHTSTISNCVGSLLPMLSTWVTDDVQEVFYSALHAEQACQTELLSWPLPGPTCPRNIGLELVAIGKARESDSDLRDDTRASPSSKRCIPPPLTDEMCSYDHDIDNDREDSEAFEV
ncbi:uncharacterized protein F5147DRAFT_780591 [Suillus discolor]|uniref:Uncharacterized protein n=1 Tax=Suillus discolor TaxID=1912936 RepID=A0A9P7EUC8_9AGAM|nr:uncharacterized protein F5147DRAFT_780591 [Suillus discolor]KAG2089637.1 hypothetical protein F5147DRAFT_780591 [Suillus discolor]